MIVFTTFPEPPFSAADVLEWYRLRWQVELMFKRFKSLAQLGHLPKYDDDSAKAWLYGKSLARMINDWQTISGALAEPPRRRQSQLSAYFGWTEQPADPPDLRSIDEHQGEPQDSVVYLNQLERERARRAATAGWRVVPLFIQSAMLICQSHDPTFFHMCAHGRSSDDHLQTLLTREKHQ